MEPQWHYLGWERPFSISFAETLREKMHAGQALEECLIWIPSARAGRHVMNELFSGAPESVEAFHPPRFVTPAQYVRSLLSNSTAVASSAQCLYAWKSVLDRADPGSFKNLFPVVPVDQKAAWAYTIADQLIRLRERLAEDNMDFVRVSTQQLTRDADRWSALAKLEKAYLVELANSALEDPVHWLARFLDTPPEVLFYRNVFVAGVLNLSKRQASCLEALSRAGLSIEFFLPAPQSRSSDFDDLSRPRCDCWEREPIEEDLLASRVQRAPEPRILVDQILELSSGYRKEIDALVVGSPEPEVSRYLIERSRLTGTPYYAPEGKVLAVTNWGRLISLLTEWQRTGSLGTFLDLFQHSLFRDWARSSGCSVESLQKATLRLQKEHLLQNMSQLDDPVLGPNHEIAQIRNFLALAQAKLFPDPPEKTGFPSWIWSFLQAISVGLKLSEESRMILGQLEELLQDLQSDFDPLKTSLADYWEILRHSMETTQHYPEREAEERPVSGWLELPWESAPHLVIIGLPDKQVPGPKNLDSFLTPVLCRSLGLYGPDELAAFHAFRLRLILECRRTWGRVDILLPDRGLDGEPTRHSRFLFLAHEEEILNRVNLLLSEQTGEELPLAATFGGTIVLPDQRPLEKISVTAFRAYLNNPFNYFLQNHQYWSAPEPLPRELDALHFGTIAHKVLEQLNGSSIGAKLTERKAIEEFLMDYLDTVAEQHFGSRFPLPLQIQLASMQERLRAAAAHIAKERQAGWFPERIEWAFNADSETVLKIGGAIISGKVDLVERNAESGQYRIVDYKTADSSGGIVGSHIGKVISNSPQSLFPECDFDWEGKQWRWRDLQLPLYQMAVESLTGERPSCAYFNLTKAVTDIGLDEWMPDKVVSDAARVCAEAIIGNIRGGNFPIAESSRYRDPWLEWFGGDYAKAIDSTWLAEHGKGES